MSSKWNQLSLLFLILSGFSLYGQDSLQVNANQKILSNLSETSSGLTIGGYGEITYNQPTGKNGELDVQRLVMLFGYKFDDRVQMVTEIEYEHVKEVYVEQAFISYSLTDNLNLRGGLMLVPMGIINEYHEPTTYNGVERPSLDTNVIPSTWREIGLGVSGRVNSLSIRYQAYLMNGFMSYKEKGLLKGSNAFRSGRQKGAQSTVSNFNIASKIEYYGVPGLRLGFASYFGRTQAPDNAPKGADVGVSMFGLDARYSVQKFSARGQYVYTDIQDSKAYNDLTGLDLGAALSGYYAELAYNVLPLFHRQKLDVFVRYENLNTHAKVSGIVKNDLYHRTEWTTGVSYHIAPGVVFKIDYQLKGTQSKDADDTEQLNVGLGFWF
jgi:hypothetical protein